MGLESAETLVKTNTISQLKSPKANMTFDERIVNSAMKAGLKQGLAKKKKVEEEKDFTDHIMVNYRPLKSGELA